jgi:hypothetical protein
MVRESLASTFGASAWRDQLRFTRVAQAKAGLTRWRQERPRPRIMIAVPSRRFVVSSVACALLGACSSGSSSMQQESPASAGSVAAPAASAGMRAAADGGGGAGGPVPAKTSTAVAGSGGARAGSAGASQPTGGMPMAAGAGGMPMAAGAGGSLAAGSGGGPSAGTGGGPSAGTGGAPSAPGGKVFAQCRFHFGSIADVVRDNPALVKELDYFTPGWMGLKDTFDMQGVCDDTKPGATFEKQVPAIVAYVAAFYAKRTANLKDCNAPGAQQDLCVAGAQVVKQNLDKIIAVYEDYAQGFAACYGTTRPIIFMMEPDFYQYTVNTQSQPWSAADAGKIMSRFVNAIKKHLPNAVFSMDISPWVAPDNGSDNGKQWYSNFDMSLFTFVNTSGGGTDASTATIRSSNKMTWRGVSEATGKPVLADTGYGVNGASAGHDPAWDDVNNISARIADGVVSISQYNPKQDWATTISALRAKLPMPRVCP